LFHYIPLFLFFLLLRPPPISTLFPYTTLFRSDLQVRALLLVDDRHVELHRGRGALFHRCERLRRIEVDDLRVLQRQVRKRIELGDRKSTRLNSSHVKISYAVFCLKKKKK